MAGYSGTPLAKKLGYKEGMTAALINEPKGFKKLLDTLPDDVTFVSPSKEMDLIHLFVKAKSELKKHLPGLKKNLKKDGMLWISWPKGSSKTVTDLNGNIVREAGLEIGLVDVKVCAVDEDWSGLKFMYRVKDRK